MKKILNTSVVLLLSAVLSGCAAISSSLHYTKGNRCLAEGDYTGAIRELEKAAETDPSMARNYTNLAYAYFLNGQYDQWWYCARQSINCPYKDPLCALQFAEACRILICEPELNKPGTSWEEIEKCLGTPDKIIKNENQQTIFCSYGTCKMYFEDEKLTLCTFFQ